MTGFYWMCRIYNTITCIVYRLIVICRQWFLYFNRCNICFSMERRIREYNRPTAKESQNHTVAKQKKKHTHKGTGEMEIYSLLTRSTKTQRISISIPYICFRVYPCVTLFEFWADEPLVFSLLIWIHKYALSMDIYSNMQIKTTLEKISIPGFQIWVNPWQLSQ